MNRFVDALGPLPRLGTLAAALLLAGCAVVPPYAPPQVDTGAGFKQAAATAAESAAWKRAEPRDGADRGAWWRVLGDARLDALMAEAERANPALQAGLARLAQARAALGGAEAARAPQVEGGLGATRARASPAALGLPAGTDVPPQTLLRAQIGASYEVDLFGRVRHEVTAARADVARAEGLQRALLLSIQADVAQSWLTRRALGAEITLLERTVALREEGLQIVSRRFAAGEIAELDVARARTELAVARAEMLVLVQRRSAVEHALAVLVGRAPAELDRLLPPPAADEGTPVFEPVQIPPGLPSELLERRPDVAAAERAMAAANARIGVAQTAWFPRLSITALLGFEAERAGDLFTGASRTWALGPLAGTALAATLFDGGRREADRARALAAYDEAAATYRQTVLGALREVEDALAALRLLAQQAAEHAQAVSASERAARLSALRYRAGQVSYFEVIDAERQVLAARRAVAQTERERALATVALIRALGGGWA